ncbi:MAG: hypothetical protein EBS21_02345 [Sphingomonadaceae bacterium]|nr:hypothetical protein [Sphingomonadaceae bacterium]
MSAPHYGDLPQDPQDAAMDASIDAADAAAWYDNGTPLTTKQAAALLETAMNTQPITEKMISVFCSGEGRYQLSRPFNQDGFTWATDGRIMVRVPQIEGFAGYDIIKPPQDVKKIFNPVLPGEFISLPKCPDERTVTCGDCDGTGRCACPHCEQDMECSECEGGGKKLDGRTIEVFDGKGIRACHLVAIKSLPNPMIALSKCGKYICFQFGGGDGIAAVVEPNTPYGFSNKWAPAKSDSKEAA